MVERGKPLHTSRSSKNEEKLGEKMVPARIPSKMISRDSQEEEEGICVVKLYFPPRKGDMQEERERGWKRRGRVDLLRLQLV